MSLSTVLSTYQIFHSHFWTQGSLLVVLHPPPEHCSAASKRQKITECQTMAHAGSLLSAFARRSQILEKIWRKRIPREEAHCPAERITRGIGAPGETHRFVHRLCPCGLGWARGCSGVEHESQSTDGMSLARDKKTRRDSLGTLASKERPRRTYPLLINGRGENW